MFVVAALVGLSAMLSPILISLHIHGLKRAGLALLLSSLALAVARLAVRRIVTETEAGRRERRDPSLGSRASRRQARRDQTRRRQ